MHATKMTDAEIAEMTRRFRVDILLAGMRLDFVDNVVREWPPCDPRS